MSDEDHKALDWVDVLIFNHAVNGYKLYSRKAIRQYAEAILIRFAVLLEDVLIVRRNAGFMQGGVLRDRILYHL